MNSKSIEEVWQKLQNLNLDPIKIKLMTPEDDDIEAWSREKADQAEYWYKCFLFLNYKYSNKNIVPTKGMDAFWHQHILDTRKYAKDCEDTFGYFMHHFPYFGIRGDDDMANLKNAFAETLELFEEEFGESPLGMRTRCCCHNCAGKCHGSCSDSGGPVAELVRPSFA